MDREIPDPPKHLRIFFVESVDPADLVEQRSECNALAGMARLIGHDVASFNVVSKRSLKEACSYIGSICEGSLDNDPHPRPMLCLHISCHGHKAGLWFGPDLVEWSTLLSYIKPVLAPEYGNERVIVLSACHADQQKLYQHVESQLEKKGSTFTPPKYIFCSNGSVAWVDAAVGWTLLYHFLPTVNVASMEDVKEQVGKVNAFGLQIGYRRWDHDKERYMKFGLKRQLSVRRRPKPKAR